MRPFQEFRLWARRAPARERVTASVAGLIAIALLVWLVVPDSDDSSTDVAVLGDSPGAPGGSTTGATDGTAPGAAGGGAAAPVAGAGGGDGGGTAPVGGDGGATGAGGQSEAGSGAQGCVSPPGEARGITADEVHVAIALTELIAVGNQLFDIPTPEEARADFEAAIAGINAEGGVACRTLVAQYVNADPTNESQMMQLCRDIADSDVFAVVDTGSLATRPAVLACFGQLQVPYFGAFFITQEAQQEFYPYLYSFYTKEHVYWSTAFALRDIGFFDPANGFQKLGFIYRDCEQAAIDAFRAWIREAGVPDEQVVTYDVGCPALFATEADLAQAVLTFQREGVTHVVPANFQGDIARFTAQAEQQGFRPRYGFPDEALLSIAQGSRSPDPDNIANAVAITLSREGENNTPGMTPTAGTERCNAYRATAGLPPVYDVPANAGHACDQLWMLQAALGQANQLSATALPVGLQRTGSIDFSFPQGANDFTGERVTTGGQFWRVAQFMPDCECWRVIQPDFRRGYG